MQVYAFVGASGTGKSHHSQTVASEYNIKYIIDDGLLINENKVVCGISAKTEPTKIGSVKAAIFMDETRAKTMRSAIKHENIDKLLILGTSDEMVDKIAQSLGLPEISKRIYIQDIATDEQIKEAKRKRLVEGKHVVPVPTFEIKEQFSGYLLDPLKIFEKKERTYKEKSIIRPTFSYLGNYTISDKVIKDVALYEGKKICGISKITRITVQKFVDGITLDIDIGVNYGEVIPEVAKGLKDKIAKAINYTTGINIFKINVYVREINI